MRYMNINMRVYSDYILFVSNPSFLFYLTLKFPIPPPLIFLLNTIGNSFFYRFILFNCMLVQHKGICYPCDQCEYAASTARSLKRHVAAVHEGEIKQRVCF